MRQMLLDILNTSRDEGWPTSLHKIETEKVHDTCKSVIDACERIIRNPDSDEPTRAWAMKKIDTLI